MVDRGHRPVISFFAPHAELITERELRLGSDSAQHARVRRVAPGDPVRIVDGAGGVGLGTVVSLTKDVVGVMLERTMQMPRPIPLEVVVPVADRDRMLLAAEKCAELQVTAWRPAYFARSRSVSPRGEGARFLEKVRARMAAALEQSGNAWLPEIVEEVDVNDALEMAPPDYSRFVLDGAGAPLSDATTSVPTMIAVGPEGGFESQELTRARVSGWAFAALAETTLRFETAIIAAVAVIRATQLKHGGMERG